MNNCTANGKKTQSGKQQGAPLQLRHEVWHTVGTNNTLSTVVNAWRKSFNYALENEIPLVLQKYSLLNSKLSTQIEFNLKAQSPFIFEV